MYIIDIEQNTPEWLAARAGKVTASAMDKIISPTGLLSKQAEAYMNRLIGDIITGQSGETFRGNAWTERGHALEDEAALYYGMLNDCDPQKVGLCVSNDNRMACSPDRLIGETGMLEVKVPDPGTGVEYLLKSIDGKEQIVQEYKPQLQAQLLITGRIWVDLICYIPRAAKQHIIRVEADTAYLVKMQGALSQFFREMDEKLDKLRNAGYIGRNPEDIGRELMAG